MPPKGELVLQVIQDLISMALEGLHLMTWADMGAEMAEKAFLSTGEEKVAGLLLAAGSSTRMGQPKQLLSVGGQTLLRKVLGEALNSDLDKVVLVLGYRAEEIRKRLGRVVGDPRLAVVENSGYEKGISSSIIVGLSTIQESHGHVMILLGDMPFIDSGLVNHLIRRYLDSGSPLGAIKKGTRRSHPVIFSHRLYHELLALKGDRGARELFRKYSDLACLVEPEGFFDDRDIDTPEDFAGFQTTLCSPDSQGT